MNSSLNTLDTSASKWCRIVSAKIAGNGLEPKMIQVNLKCAILEFRSLGSLSHKNRSISLSVSLIPTIRMAFSMSAVRPILYQLNLTSVSSSCGAKFRLVSRCSMGGHVQVALLIHHTRSSTWSFHSLSWLQHGKADRVHFRFPSPSVLWVFFSQFHICLVFNDLVVFLNQVWLL